MKLEVWRDVPGYLGYYQVSNTGIVRSLDRTVLYSDGRKRFYKGEIIDGSNNEGYREIGFSKNGKVRIFKVSQLVAMTFLGHIPNGNTLVIDHIDGDRANDNVDNLRIVTSRENNSTCYRTNEDSFTSNFVGVCWAKNNKKWVGAIRYNDAQIHLGYFDNELEASDAYQKALGEINNNTFNPENYKPKCMSKYKGVTFNKDRQKWLSRLTINGKRTYLGSFATELEAYGAIQKFKQEVKKH